MMASQFPRSSQEAHLRKGPTAFLLITVHLFFMSSHRLYRIPSRVEVPVDPTCNSRLPTYTSEVCIARHMECVRPSEWRNSTAVYPDENRQGQISD